MNDVTAAHVVITLGCNECTANRVDEVLLISFWPALAPLKPDNLICIAELLDRPICKKKKRYYNDEMSIGHSSI